MWPWPILRIAAFAYRNYLFAVKNFFTFAELLFWPLIQILSIGLMGQFLALEPDLQAFLLTGAIVAGVLQVAQLDVAYGFLYDVWSKSVKQTLLAPVALPDILIGSWLFGLVRGGLAFILLSLIAAWGFGFHLPAAGTVAVAMAGVFINALLVGMTVLFFIFLYGQRIDIIAWILSVLLMLVCGIYYPVGILPEAMQPVAAALPLTYFLEYFRIGYGFTPTFTHLLAKGFGLSAAYLVLAYVLIRFAHNRARRTGMILKLSE